MSFPNAATRIGAPASGMVYVSRIEGSVRRGKMGKGKKGKDYSNYFTLNAGLDSTRCWHSPGPTSFSIWGRVGQAKRRPTMRFFRVNGGSALRLTHPTFNN